MELHLDNWCFPWEYWLYSDLLHLCLFTVIIIFIMFVVLRGDLKSFLMRSIGNDGNSNISILLKPLRFEAIAVFFA